jgi:iron complex outermembrane receptor protein
MTSTKTRLSIMVAACFASTGAFSQDMKLLSPVVVTATKTEQDSFDLPMAIDKVEQSDIQDGKLRMTLSESLARIPGITAQNRNQMAQDPQISSRGFGARSSFGVRGLRVYVDGIPLSMPDGIGNPGSVDLDTIGAIEVMRGPFSAMYGNSSGGVIQMFSEASPATPEVSGDLLLGSFNTRRESVKAAGTKDGIEYLLNYSDYSSNGFRQHSQNEKTQATARIGIKLNEDTKLTTLINAFDQTAQDPGGLKRDADVGEPSAFTSPTGVSIGAINNNARVIRSNTQVGFNLEHRVDAANTLNLITYAGHRDNLQYLSLGGSGRASSISRDFYGTEIRGTNKGNLLEKPYTISYGIAAGFMEDARLDKSTSGGEVSSSSSTNRSETQKAQNFDQYVQGMWSVDKQWDLHAGLRHTKLTLDIQNKLSNSLGSGSLDFSKTIPVVGVVFKATPVMNFYANIGQGFETPTLIEITYTNPSTPAGPNFAIKPSTSTNIEVGSKLLLSDNTRVNVAVFDISTENEIVTALLQGSTASFKNAGKTKRTGTELSVQSLLPNNVSLFAAYTLLNATFNSDFKTGNSDTTVPAGNVIPGTYRTQLYAEAAWKYSPLGFQTALEGRYNSKVYVNDTNTDTAPSNTIFSIRSSLQQVVGKWRVTEYARIENIFDRSYIGSVRVNDTTANSRFFEPGAGRNWIAGVKGTYAF